MSGGFCATMQGRFGIWRSGIMGIEMSRQLFVLLKEASKCKGCGEK